MQIKGFSPIRPIQHQLSYKHTIKIESFIEWPMIMFQVTKYKRVVDESKDLVFVNWNITLCQKK